MTAQRDMSGRAWAELMLLSAIWGASFLAIRTALDEVPVLTSVAHRVFWAAIVLWAIIGLRGLPVPRDRRVLAGFLGMGLLNNVIPFSLMAWGQLHIETGLASILNAATAIWGTLLAAMLFRDERMTTRKVTGIALGFAGVVTAIGAGALASFDIRSAAQLAVIGGTLSYAAAGSWAKIRLTGLHPIVAAAGMLTAASVAMVPAALVVDGPPKLDLAPTTILAIAYYALVSTAFAYLLYYRVLGMAGSANLLLCTLMIPPVAIALGAVVRHESLGPNAFAGFLLLALGLMVLDGRLLRRLGIAGRRPAARD